MTFWLTSLMLLATPAQRTVAVIDLRTPVSALERATLPEVPTAMSAPREPASSAPEQQWVDYRAAHSAYVSGHELWTRASEARKAAERAIRDAAKARSTANRRASSLLSGVESTLRGLRTFKVITARTLRRTLVESEEKHLEACANPRACVSPWARRLQYHYVVTLSATVDGDQVRLVWHMVQPKDVVAVSDVLLDRAKSSRDGVIEAFEPMRLVERDRNVEEARRSAAALDWEAALVWVERALRLDSSHGPTLYVAGRVLFARGDMRGAARRLQAAIELEQSIGEANHILGLIDLRRRSEDAAQEHFSAALAAGRDSLEARTVLARAAEKASAKSESPEAESKVAEEHWMRALELEPGHGEASYALGQLLRRREQRAGAIAHFRSAVGAGFKTADSELALGEALLADGNKEEGLLHLEQGRRAGAADKRTLLLLARSAVKLEPKRAVSLFLQARQSGAREAAVDLELARVALVAGDNRTARSALGRVVGDEKLRGIAEELIGGSYVDEKNASAAARHFKAAIAQGRDSYAARRALGTRATSLRRWSDALEHWGAALGFKAEDGTANWGLGVAHHAQGHHSDATPFLLRAIRAGVEVARAHRLIGDMAAADDKPALMRKHYEAAVAHGLEDLAIIRTLAQTAHGERRQADAAGLWAKALKLSPGDAEASFRRGEILLRNGDKEAAQPLLAYASKSSVWRFDALTYLGSIEESHGKWEQAYEYYVDATRLRTPQFSLLLATGRAGLAAKELDSARTFLARALAHRPGDASASLLLGRVELERGHPEQAKLHLKRVLAAKFRAAEVHSLLGRAAEELGEKDGAVMHFETALAGGVATSRAHLALALRGIAQGRNKAALEHYVAAALLARREGSSKRFEVALSGGKGLAKDPDAFERKVGAYEEN